MPSQLSSWFARHCTPPPPLNTSSTCPCANCYNLGMDVRAQQQQHHQQQSQQHQHVTRVDESSRRSSTNTTSSSAWRSDADALSVSSAAADKSGATITTTTHIERVTPQQ
ncbi:ubiquitin interaction domain-containing protein [Purpureocillium lavendulum]|uniref:Ubiquitin interaction domain-containing protein n=1 Tax=Purpureocillium lavendulum TaxID=1247861 RepID=A0AB34FRK6_9HYPO|nr:ubiquitin interaction domain-containing protein [Purpureocillium lavendulum]